MPGKYSSALRETKRVSTEGIYEHRSALVATSGLHNSTLLMCWNCFWRQTDWYNGAVWALKGRAASAEVWLTDLGSIYPFALALFGVSAETTEPAELQGPLRGARGLLRTGNGPLLFPWLTFTANELMPLILCLCTLNKLIQWQCLFASYDSDAS